MAESKESKDLTIPEGTILHHTRASQFPAGGTHPTYPYAWYCSKPFTTCRPSCQAIYTYKVRKTIAKVFDWNLDYEQQAKDLQQYEPRIVVEEDNDDYSIAAFVIQVLGFEGMMDRGEGGMCVVLSAEAGQTYLELIKVELCGSPSVHPGYTSLVPEGDGYMSTFKSPYHYTPEEIAALRKKIPASMLCPS